MDVALIHDAPEEFLRVGRPGVTGEGLTYSVRREDYVRLCRHHHLLYDGRA